MHLLLDKYLDNVGSPEFIKDLNLINDTMKTSEKNSGECYYNLRAGKSFLIPKAPKPYERLINLNAKT